MTTAHAGSGPTRYPGHPDDLQAREASRRFSLKRTAMNVARKTALALTLGAVSLLAPIAARAQAPVTDDTYSTRGGAWNNGSSPLVIVQSPNTNGYVRFNLSVFPPDMQPGDIQKATLKMFVNSVQGAGTLYVCRLEANQAWDEKTLVGREPACDPGTEAIPALMTKDMILNYVVIDVTPIVQYWYANPGVEQRHRTFLHESQHRRNERCVGFLRVERRHQFRA